MGERSSWKGHYILFELACQNFLRDFRFKIHCPTIAWSERVKTSIFLIPLTPA